MNPSDVQPETEPEYFDPEEPDMSEQQFAASLGITQERPQFVLDDADVAERAESSPSGSPADARSPVEFEEKGSPANVAATSEPLPEHSSADWRDQVSAKVNNYRARKPHKDRYPSLRLPFEPVARKSGVPDEHSETFDPRPEVAAKEEPLPPPLPPPLPRIVLETTARVLEFPRSAVFPKGDELAEPVVDRPRIVEAPELLPPPPAMGGILIEQQLAPEPERRPGFDLPLQSSSLRRRILAGVFDSVLIAAALAVFGYVFVRLNGSMLPLRQASMLAAALIVVFWAAYQYGFLVFTARTPGLWAAKLRVTRFDGAPAARRLRRWRVLASLLSLASLGLGYAWCFLDEDQLSWHDRITKTHLAPN